MCLVLIEKAFIILYQGLNKSSWWVSGKKPKGNRQLTLEKNKIIKWNDTAWAVTVSLCIQLTFQLTLMTDAILFKKKKNNNLKRGESEQKQAKRKKRRHHLVPEVSEPHNVKSIITWCITWEHPPMSTAQRSRKLRLDEWVDDDY